MASLGWLAAIQARHAELVSASMARSLLRRRAKFEGRPWTLKQVQGDEEFNVLFRSFPTFVIPDLIRDPAF